MEGALAVMMPVYIFLRSVDSNTLQIGEIYLKIRAVRNEIRDAATNYSKDALKLFDERLHGTGRKLGFHHPLHTTAMMLHPKNWHVDFGDMYPAEFGSMRQEFISVIDKVSLTSENAQEALIEYDNQYKLKLLGIFQMPLVQSSAPRSDPVAWWNQNCSEIPHLQYVAVRILSLACANSAAERNWSLHGFLFSKSRNRMSFPLQKQLVNVHSNLKLKRKLRDKEATDYLTDEEFGQAENEPVPVKSA
jgi:hypothetical protein